MKKRASSLLFLLFLFFFCRSLVATEVLIHSYTTTIKSGLTYQGWDGDGALMPDGTSYYYHEFPFQVDTDGLYGFCLMTVQDREEDGGWFDLLSGAFDAADPSVSTWIVSSSMEMDECPFSGGIELTAGTSYFLVASTWSQSTLIQRFTIEIMGPTGSAIIEN